MPKNKGWLGFDWIMPGAITLSAFERGTNMSSSVQVHMTPAEAEIVARRLLAWAAYKRDREQGVVARQPGNHCTLKAAPIFRPR